MSDIEMIEDAIFDYLSNSKVICDAGFTISKQHNMILATNDLNQDILIVVGAENIAILVKEALSLPKQ